MRTLIKITIVIHIVFTRVYFSIAIQVKNNIYWPFVFSAWYMKKNTLSVRHYILFIQALVATLGSLYYGFYGDPFSTPVCFDAAYALEPCTLCWYARILMYPIVLISLVGILRKKRSYIRTVLPLVALWIPLEMYHYYLQKVTVEGNTFTCTANVPCAALEVNYFWRLTIPLLCLIAFIVIGICCWMIWKENK